MTTKLLLLWAWIILRCGRASGSSQGRRFFAAFMENGLQKSSGDSKFKLFISGLQDGTSVNVTIHKSDFQKDFVVKSGETVPVHLPSHIEMVGTKTFHSTVIVKSSRDITVLSLSSKPKSTDTTVVYPRYLLGNTYYVVTPLGQASKGLQEFSVVACQDPTQVYIYVTCQVTFEGVTYSAGSKLTISLEAYQAVQIQSHQDLSGSKVVSHKAVAVFSGHSCIWLHDHCQHVFEQLLPIRKWGKVFLVAPLSFQTNHTVACVTAHQKTHLQIRAGGVHSQRHVQAGQVVMLEVSIQKPLYISSNVRVQVLFYSTGGVKDGVPYNPFLSRIPAVADYSKSYYILGQDGFQNLALLVAETRTCQGITFDGQPLHSAYWQAIPSTSYSWAEFSFSRQLRTHIVQHPKSAFSLLSIGVARYNSYGSLAFAVDSTRPPVSPPAKPCSEMHCGKGYVCTIRDNQLMCIPEPQTCNAIQCQGGTVCEMAQGLPRCVPYPLSCHHVQCPEGTMCDLAGGFPKCLSSAPPSCFAIQCKRGTLCTIANNRPECVPAPASCQNIRCRPGTVCSFIDGWPKCVPIQPSCEKVHCQDGTFCEMVHGQPQCLPAPAPCGVILCEKGNVCEVVDGQPKCVSVPPSCLHMECRQGTLCVVVDGWPTCIPGPSCNNLRCESGAECKGVNGLPSCVPTVVSCRGKIQCKPGMVCEIVNNMPTCVRVPTSCDQVSCREGTICQIVDGWTKCVPTITSCAEMRCPVGTVCEMVNKWPTCVPLPYSCERTECLRGTVCEMVNGWPTCIPDLLTSCTSVDCKEGSVCQMLDGEAACIPIPLSCKSDSCGAGMVCEVVNGWPTCVPLPPSCQETECQRGTTCEMVNGWPTCVSLPSTCDKVQCKEGTVCEIVSNWPKCIQAPHSCKNISCKQGTMCEIAKGGPKCIPAPPSCDKVRCAEGAVCKMVDSRPHCAPVPTSCDKIQCKEGTICEIVDSWARCVAVPASCDKIHCKNRTICEMIDDWPTCIPDPSSCDQISCKEGTFCEIRDGWPKCVPVPSCNKLQCKAGTICERVDGRPKCVPAPSTCGNIQCKEGAVCKVIDNWPKCVPAPLSCENVTCDVGTVCEMLNGHPRCVHLPPSCDKFICHPGTVCKMVDNWPKCVPVSPSCGKMRCHVGTVCDIVNGQPKCVPMPASCEGIRCPRGTVCQVTNGWPQCAQATQSCHGVRCSQGTICKLLDGSPKCVSVLPSQPVCWASGQLHYHTFDGRSYDFQGTCTYTVVKVCEANSKLPFFHIFTKSQKSSKSPVSYISQVTVTIYGSNITMVKYEYGLVRVNQSRSRLPIVLHDGKLSLDHRGGQLVVETQFGLKVYYDWNHYLVVKVTPAFRGHICGLCGNSNGDPNDDIVTSLGALATDPVAFGKGWKVEDGDGTCSHGCYGKCWHCSPELATRYSGNTYCGLIAKHRGGPFWRCHTLIDPKPYLDDCVADLCTFEGYKQILCRALKTYADACQREGATISTWRKHTGCPLACPENSQYVLCGSACPANCNNIDAPKCHLPCMETCQCKPGYVLDGGRCIPPNHCGCVYHGQLYTPNEPFWGDQQCHQQCLCRSQDRKVICHTSHCREGEACRVVHGIRKCYPCRR